MRTTVTLDPDVEARIRLVMRERGCSFKAALNDAVRSSIGGPRGSRGRYEVNARSMGLRPGINLDHALSLADELEDAEIVRKLRLRK